MKVDVSMTVGWVLDRRRMVIRPAYAEAIRLARHFGMLDRDKDGEA